ncbi:MAG: hypothetical protein ACD_2C00242G0002 [uncultured bacterium (gcode 4)]|uniref:Uncharacterized protein n=1 Tax=uncultured bacterium (gcode 4) TaxID=1234023 RepID=K2GZU1_9BACT|nr:MAG: hypothetical protein ACD_2C00242G0002 [uncultured bacterium (gcode 4)]
MSFAAVSHRIHWFQIVPHEYVKEKDLSGEGYFQAFTLNISTDFLMYEISVRRVESRAEPDCEENERKAIVAKIEIMTITTISSTKVKAEFCFDVNIERRN